MHSKVRERFSGCSTFQAILGRGMVGILAASLLAIALPGLSFASHGGEAPEGCQECHSLGAGSAISGTSYVKAGSRTLSSMLLEGWGVGDKFACTYCHSNPANDAGGIMVNALDDFGTHGSIHFVGKKRDLAGTNTDFEFVSNADGVDYAGAVVTDELDCIDCHDPALLTDGVYPNHLAPGSRGGNPYMLRDVTSMENFCNGCHGASPAAWWTNRVVAGKDPIPAMPHAEVSLSETDATPLKTSTCTDCHDIHFSTTKVKLFNDGKDGDIPIVATDCITVCHYAGDNVGYNSDTDNNYTRHGHGKPDSTYKYAGGVVDFSGSYVTLGFSCTRCHMNIDTSDTGPTRKPHIENPATADPKDDYIQRFNLDSTIQASDTESVFGNPIYGVCFDCHDTYDNHTGGAGDTGCQDCHDEHGEGSGVASNYFMIPETSRPNGNFDINGDGFGIVKAGAESVIYDMTRRDPSDGSLNTPNLDFYSGSGASSTGVCDNSECHGGAAWWGTELADRMNAGHSGGTPQVVGSDCASCHKHTGDPGGGWRATESCDTCHSDNTGTDNLTGIARTHADANESLAAHDRHIASAWITDCADCHLHDGKSVAPNSGTHADGTVNFSGGLLPAIDYSLTGFGETTCSTNNTCHDDDAGDWFADSLGSAPDSCTDCHGATGKTLDQGGYPPVSAKHSEHINDAPTAYVDDCNSCHGPNANTGTHGNHKDQSLDLGGVITPPLAGDNSCTNLCHNSVDGRDWEVTGTLVCTDCHNPGSGYLGTDPLTGLHDITPTITGEIHDENLTGGGGVCTTCHTLVAGLPSHINGIEQADANDNSESRGLFGTYIESTGVESWSGTCATACHEDAGAWGRRWSDTADDTAAISLPVPSNDVICANCHGTFLADGFVSGISERHGGPDAGGEIQSNHTGGLDECSQCHVYDDSVAFVAYDWGTKHRDATVQLNSENSFIDEGATVQCLGCHPSDPGLTDGTHSFRDTENTDGLGAERWAREMILGPSGSCTGCHESILGAPLHGDANESGTTHDTVHSISNPYITNCADCHTHDGSVPPGTGDHNTGMVNFTGSNLTPSPATSYDYDPLTSNFQNTNCSTANACHSTTINDWTAGAGNLVCMDCHTGTYVGGGANAPASGLHAVTPSVSGEQHDDSFNSAGSTCTDCHNITMTNLTTGPATHVDGAFTGDTVANLTLLGAINYGQTVPNSGAGTCVTTCHTTLSGDWEHVWTNTVGYYTSSPTACGGCHGIDFGAGMNTGVIHKNTTDMLTTHVATATTYQCDVCHVLEATGAGAGNYVFTFSTNDWGGGSNHGNAVIEVNDKGSYNGANPGYCTACHSVPPYDMADTSWALDTAIVGDDIDAGCGSCHSNGLTTASASAAHAAHNATVADLTADNAADCQNCHGAGAYTSALGGTHGDGDVTFSGVTYSAYVPATLGLAETGTCRTTACHNSGATADQSDAWNSAGLACNDCHYFDDPNPTGALNLASDRPISTSHEDHFDAGKDCWTCHSNVNLLDVSAPRIHISGTTLVDRSRAVITDNASVAPSNVIFDQGLNTCTDNGGGLALGCHATGTPDWDNAFASNACTECHTDTTTPAVNPTSGLHNVTTPTIDDHDSTLTGGSGTGCEKCHDAAVSGADHQDGFLEDSVTVAYTWNLANIPSSFNPGADTCSSVCHGDWALPNNGDDASWRRRWINFTDAEPGQSGAENGAVCQNCHGEFTGWRFENEADATTIDHTDPDPGGTPGDSMTNHTCGTCHGWGHANYSGVNSHQDGSVTMNATLGYDGSGGCTTNCHTPYTLSMEFNSGWGDNTVLGDSVTCGGCHLGGVQVGTTSGAHTNHNAGSGQLVSGGAACVACHGNNGGLGFESALAGTHGTGSVQFSGASYSTAVRNDLTGTCTTTSCHNQGADQSSLWSASGLACNDCHYYAAGTTPTSAASSLSADHGNHFDTGGSFSCTDCHADNSGDVSDPLNHVSGVALTDRANAVMDEATVTAAALGPQGTDPGAAGATCDNTACHDPSVSNNVYDAQWMFDTATCTLCHAGTAGDPGTGDHTKHLNASGTFGISIACADCHTIPGSMRHRNGTVNFSGLTYTAPPSGTAGCGVNSCHNNGKNVQARTFPYNWDNATAITDCDECHADTNALQTNEAHAGHNAVSGAGCGDCHTGATGVTHINGFVNLAAGITYSGIPNSLNVTLNTFGTCNTTACHNSGGDVSEVWNNSGADLACDDCHYYGDPVSAIGNTGPQSIGGSHSQHFTANGVTVCTQCHPDNSTDTATPLNHITGATLAARAIAVEDEATVTAAALGATGVDNDPGTITCDNTECHNPSNDSHASNDWGVGNTGCEMCHNSSTSPATVPVGSHPEHVTAKGYACTECHDNNVGNDAHYNSTVNFPNFTYNGDANNYPGSYGTCTGACHAGGLVWGGTPSNCSDCHLTASVDINNFNGIDTTATNINSTEWSSFGHGAKAVDCLDCHTFSASHVNTNDLAGANPFRLQGGFSCSDTSLGCHEVGTTGPATGLDISTFVTHDDSTMGSTQRNWPAWNPECVNCHDPHGDGNNLSMIQRELYDKASFSLPAGPAPTAPTEQTTLVFTNDATGASTAGTSYADSNADYSSICQECHEDASMNAFEDGAAGTGAGGSASVAPHPTPGGNPGDCSNCHTHDTGFTPAGCNGCHGGSLAGKDDGRPYCGDSKTGGSTPGTVAGSLTCSAGDAARPNSVGAHDTHIDNVGLSCNDCHYNGGTQAAADPGGHPESGLSNITGLATPGDLDIDVSETYALVASPIYDDGGDPRLVEGAPPYKVCGNISCHYGETPDWAMRAQCIPGGTISVTDPSNGGSVPESTNHTVVMGGSGYQGGTEQYNINDGGWQGWTGISTLWASGGVRAGLQIQGRALDSTCTTDYIYSSINTFQVTSCIDGDVATLTTNSPSGTVSGSNVLIQTAVGVEPAGNMANMRVTIDNPLDNDCDVTGALMSQNGSNYEYTWDTSACATSATEPNVTIDVSGDDPDCGGSTKNAATVVVSINNALVPISVGLNTSGANGSSTTANYTYVEAYAPSYATGTGTLTSLTVFVATAGDIKLFTATPINATNYQITDIQTYTLSGSGWQTFPINLNVSTGDAMGFVSVSGTQIGRLTATGSYRWATSDVTGGGIGSNVVTTGGPTTSRQFGWQATGLGTPAPPSSTGGGTATACDTCHEFAPNDDILDASGHPDATAINGTFGYMPEKPADYTYIDRDPGAPLSGGDHIRHAMGDQGVPSSPSAANAGDGAIDCDTCHGAGVTSYTNQHTDGGNITMGSRDSGTNIQGGYYQTVSNTCINVGTSPTGCHLGNATPEWGVGQTTCTSCHGDPPATNAHNRHARGNAGEFSFTCDTCHPEDHDGASDDIAFTGIAATWGGATYTPGSMNCSTVYCHGGASPNWNSGAQICGTCHGDAAGRPTTPPTGGGHTTGSGVNSHSNRACSDCHSHVGGTAAEHVDGSANVNGDADVSASGAQITTWGGYGANLGTDGDGYRYSSSSCTPSCHSVGTWGGVGGCDFCHGYPPDGTGGSTDHTSTGRTGQGSTDPAFYAAHSVCETCHGVAGNQTPPTLATARTAGIDARPEGDQWIDSMHDDGSVQMNGAGGANVPFDDANTDYNAGTGACDNAGCHTNGTRFTSLGTNTVELREWGGGSCLGCHDDGGGSGAPQVNDLSPHVITTRAGSFNACEDCHPFHSGGTDIALIPNSSNANLGISYTLNGETGIYLGGTATKSGGWATGSATEAEICWDCHDAGGTAGILDGTDISEWGTNTDTNTGTYTDYDFGNLTGSYDWTGTIAGNVWHSALEGAAVDFAYKARPIISTHAADTGTAPLSTNTGGNVGVDPIDTIRCSYCHDVHDTLAGSPTGAPFLRGTWMGSPYKEDGAPQLNQTMMNTGGSTDFGAVPRGSNSTSNAYGGYWIDQNSSWGAAGPPTPAWSEANNSGLCALCHGNANGGWEAGEIDALDVYGTNDWAPGASNGHSSAVIGGNQGSAFDIFPDRTAASSWSTNEPEQHWFDFNSGDDGPGDWQGGVGFRESGDALNYQPTMGNSPTITNTDRWGVTEYGGSQPGYHNFPCSKCHNPHASRLPRLMITNCLDTGRNTWDNAYQLAGSTGVNTSTSVSNWTSAQNCHRYPGVDNCDTRADVASPAGLGWNAVTPWATRSETINPCP